MALIFMIPCTTAIIGGVYMATNGIDGWGWLLFVAVLLFPSWRKE